MDAIDFKSKTILVVGAHPDDNDFGAGATVAKAAKQGAEVIYLLATTGQRGSSDESMTPEKLSRIRKKEQEEAASVLGVRQVHFLDYVDGELVPDIRLKEHVVKFIRRTRPDIVFTMDPSFFSFKDFGFVIILITGPSGRPRWMHAIRWPATFCPFPSTPGQG